MRPASPTRKPITIAGSRKPRRRRQQRRDHGPAAGNHDRAPEGQQRRSGSPGPARSRPHSRRQAHRAGAGQRRVLSHQPAEHGRKQRRAALLRAASWLRSCSSAQASAAREGKTAQVESDLALARRWGADPKDIQAVQAIPCAKNASGNNCARQARVAGLADEQAETHALRRAGVPGTRFSKSLRRRHRGVRRGREWRAARRARRVGGPAGVFDHAAIAAVKRWRYEPVIVNNVPTEVPARTSIRFALPNQ